MPRVRLRGPRPDIKPSGVTGVSVLVTEARGTIDENFFGKMVGPASTLEQMCFPQVMYDPDDWRLGWGLGLTLWNHEGAIYAGHGGAMAGHLAGVYVNRKTEIGAAALTNSGTP